MTTVLLISALLYGPATTPARTAWLVIEPHHAESAVVLSEWDRAWLLFPLRAECEFQFRFRITDLSRTSGIAHVPSLVVGEQCYPLRASYSSQAIREIRRIVRLHENDDGGYERHAATDIWIGEALP